MAHSGLGLTFDLSPQRDSKRTLTKRFFATRLQHDDKKTHRINGLRQPSKLRIGGSNSPGVARIRTGSGLIEKTCGSLYRTNALAEENKIPTSAYRSIHAVATLFIGSAIATIAHAEDTFTLKCKLHSEQTVWNNDGSNRRITTSTIIRTLTIDLDQKQYYVVGDGWSARDIPKITATEIILDNIKFGDDASRFAKINRATGLYTADVQSGRWMLYELGPCEKVQTELPPPAKF